MLKNLRFAQQISQSTIVEKKRQLYTCITKKEKDYDNTCVYC